MRGEMKSEIPPDFDLTENNGASTSVPKDLGAFSRELALAKKKLKKCKQGIMR